jgi:hypothetical protein
MYTTITLDGAVHKMLDDLLCSLRLSGVTITRKEAAFSLICNGLKDLDAMKKQGVDINAEFLKKFVNFRGKMGRPGGQARHVVRVEDGEVFDSCFKAAMEMQVTEYSIRNAINGKSKTCGGYHWQYVERDFSKSTDSFLEE